MVIDIKDGTFGATNLEKTDWGAAATASAVASVASFSSGSKQSSDFNAAGLAAINAAGRTQLRLRFVNNNPTNNYIPSKRTNAKLYVEYSD